MSTVNTGSNSTVSQALMESMNGTKKTASTDPVTETQDRFMQLLVAQMKNQDPLNPLDNAQVTSQMAQLSTVTGVNKLNTTMETMLAGFNANQSLQAAGMIGRGVFVPGNAAVLSKGQALLGVEMAEPADSVVITIRDAKGNEVQKLDLGPRAAGTWPLAWDGKTRDGTAADGVYSFEVTATRGGSAVNANRLSYAEVGSVTTASSGIKLNLTNSSSVGLSDVRQIF